MSTSPHELIAHILIEIDYLQRTREAITEHEFSQNETLQRAFARSLEIIGEAVKKIDPATKERYKNIDWRKIAGMRDKLIHDYSGIDYSLVWDVVREKVDVLKKQLEDFQ